MATEFKSSRQMESLKSALAKWNQFTNWLEEKRARIDIMFILLIVLYTSFILSHFFSNLDPLLPNGDVFFLDYPFRILAWESISKGEPPLWNPYISGGRGAAA